MGQLLQTRSLRDHRDEHGPGHGRRRLVSAEARELPNVVSLQRPGAPFIGHRQTPASDSQALVRRALFERLEGAGRVTQVSAPAGSGKTCLLRSWIRDGARWDNAAWVSVHDDERDPQRFWISVADALRDTGPGSKLVRGLTAAPDLDVGAVVERLLEDLGPLEDPVWLVVDDLHQLRSSDALRQFELLLMRAPAKLRVVLSTRHDLRLGLHRLRIEGELTEVRAADLRFTLDEARVLFESAGAQLPDSALAQLVERTEGWAAGLRLAAVALAGHPDPEAFASEFSGSERTVAEYLLAEVLERQPEEVRRLLLRTSILERVSGPLADLLTGAPGGERILQELEKANAFVVPLDARRSWFRYHRLFADLLALELRRTAPAELPGLHGAAAEWFAENGYPVEAVRHAQAAGNWDLAARLLSDHAFGLHLDGQAATLDELLAGFPAGVIAADPELIAVMATKATRGSLEEAERYLALASERSASVPADRRGHMQVKLAIQRLSLAQLRGDLVTTIEEAERLLSPAETPDPAQLGLGEDLAALALLILGVAELWGLRVEAAERHLERAVALARRINRPWLEVSALAHLAMHANLRSFSLASQRATQAIELARRHGWSEEPITGAAYLALGLATLCQGRLEQAEPWLEHAERTLPPEVQRAAGLLLHSTRGVLELACGRGEAALVAFRAAERLGEHLTTPTHPLMAQPHGHLLATLVRLGQTEAADQVLAELDGQERDTGEIRTAVAMLRLAQDEPDTAMVMLAPVLDGSAPSLHPLWQVSAFLLEATAHDSLGDAGAAERAVERALDIAEPDGLLLPFLLHQTPELLGRHSRHRTTHASLISEILGLLAGRTPPSAPGEPDRLREPLTEGEIRIMRYLPTNLSLREIGDELYLSVNTIKAHIRHLYGKLDVHSRGEAVERARSLGLLAPSARTR